MSRNRSALPHSWSIATWPSDVWPHNERKARYTIRENKNELMAAGVLSRVGRELVVLGDRYGRWLEKKAVDVPGYQIAPNLQRDEAAT